MALSTTCLGAWPKPADLPIRDWFQVSHGDPDYADRVMAGWAHAQSDQARRMLDVATADVVQQQVRCGIDVPTDGELRRENYVHYQCRHFDGFDFEELTERVVRNGAYATRLPSIRGPVRSLGNGTLVRDWRIAQAAAPDRPVKMTLPGPMTISDTTADLHYGDPEALAHDLAQALNAEVRALADAGCQVIQIDEPIFARKPDHALAYGVDALRACVAGIDSSVTTVMHMCCGYPNHLDDHDYPKADPTAYLRLAAAVDGVVDQISIEDAHRHNPVELFERFERSAVIVGCIRIASSQVETADAIAERLFELTQHVPTERLIAAPDCGLGFLTAELAVAKLAAMVDAAGRL